MNKKITLFSVILMIMILFSSCTTVRTEYIVDDEVYAVQEKGQFARPEDPNLGPEKKLDGWMIEGTQAYYTDWNVQPAGVVRMIADISDVQKTEYYVNGELYAVQNEGEFKKPADPTVGEYQIFEGWVMSGSTEYYDDWYNQPEGIVRFDADITEVARFYLSGQEWAVVRLDEFGNPGDPTGKDIERGYVFEGWVPENEYFPVEDWSTYTPEVRRFDALLSRETALSGYSDANASLRLNLNREFQVLGPVTVSESYEIIDGKLKVGGIGYSDIVEAALEKYPTADQVINIIVDYKNVDYVTDSATGKSMTFRQAIYTGIAIDIL